MALGVLLASFALLAAMPAAGAILVLAEAESYVDTKDMGGVSIASVFCADASGQYAVDGLDIVNEWIEVKATITDEACYGFQLGYQAPYGETIETLVTVFDEGHSTIEGEAPFEFVGWGLG